jgi:hypothetical protein
MTEAAQLIVMVLILMIRHDSADVKRLDDMELW